MEQIKLTQYSHGAGCGCKISPSLLSEILKDPKFKFMDPRLLVGNEDKDDAAVLDLGNGTSLISTTDFFMPIVDDPFDFGRIAATNAISDIFAMGGTPCLAIAILGWPIDKVPVSAAREVIHGANKVCSEVGITIAGGHSIDNPEPLFGLAVNGFVSNKCIKKNSSALPGSTIYLTKKLGVGILTTAKKKNLVSDLDYKNAIESMLIVNKIGSEFGQDESVLALTDVTGFGFLGHLNEICEASNVSAEVNFKDVPVLDNIENYINQNCIPGGTSRNWNSYGDNISGITDYNKAVLCDPQTSGGLLVVIKEGYENQFESKFGTKLSALSKVGQIKTYSDKRIFIK